MATPLTDLLDLVLPRECPGCGRPATALCPDCLADLCAAAGRRDPTPAPPGLPPVHSAADYQGLARTAVLAHKERGDRGLTPGLGAALAAAVTATGVPGPLVLVPVPTSRRAVAARGDDTVLLIARAAARALGRAGRPVRVVSALRPVGRRADSAGLDARQRAANLAGAFVAARRAARLPGSGAILVVDDVVTTGATLAAAAGALAGAGVPPIAAATVAATRRRYGAWGTPGGART